MKLGLHIHSEYSHDSKTSVEEILEAAENAGFDAIAITDHNTTAGGLEALKKAGRNVSVIPAAEFSTQYGHVLAYFIDDSIEKNTPRINDRQFDFYSIIQNVKKINGVAILAHPYVSGLKDNPAILEHIDGIEQYNSRLDSFLLKAASQRFVKQFLGRNGFLYTGGSDAHSADELANCYMQTDDFELKPEGFTNALRSGSAIYCKRAANYAVAKAKLYNMKKFRPAYAAKNGIRLLYGAGEIILSKMLRCREYEAVFIGKEN
jgi:predicted metal-dependent phosphoesterase TrpH